MFQWDPGDGSDIVEGQSGQDRVRFNGSNANEIFDVSANGERVRFFRNVGNIVLDLNDVEGLDLSALGGTDTITARDLSGTDLAQVTQLRAGSSIKQGLTSIFAKSLHYIWGGISWDPRRFGRVMPRRCSRSFCSLSGSVTQRRRTVWR